MTIMSLNHKTKTIASFLLLPILAFYFFAPNFLATSRTTATINHRANHGFGLSANPFRYSGYYQDFESKMNYLKARYYSPKLVRFISRDTYDLSNRYAYCDGNPIGKIDPEGHMPSFLTITAFVFSFLATGAAFTGVFAARAAGVVTSDTWIGSGLALLGGVTSIIGAVNEKNERDWSTESFITSLIDVFSIMLSIVGGARMAVEYVRAKNPESFLIRFESGMKDIVSKVKSGKPFALDSSNLETLCRTEQYTNVLERRAALLGCKLDEGGDVIDIMLIRNTNQSNLWFRSEGEVQKAQDLLAEQLQTQGIELDFTIQVHSTYYLAASLVNKYPTKRKFEQLYSIL